MAARAEVPDDGAQPERNDAMTTRGYVGRLPVTLREDQGGGSVASPQAPRPSDNNQKTAVRIAAGVETWDFNGQQVAAHLVSMDTAHQKRVAQIVFNLVRVWARMAEHGHSTAHPMYQEYEQARAMQAGLNRGK